MARRRWWKSRRCDHAADHCADQRSQPSQQQARSAAKGRCDPEQDDAAHQRTGQRDQQRIVAPRLDHVQAEQADRQRGRTGDQPRDRGGSHPCREDPMAVPQRVSATGRTPNRVRSLTRSSPMSAGRQAWPANDHSLPSQWACSRAPSSPRPKTSMRSVPRRRRWGPRSCAPAAAPSPASRPAHTSGARAGHPVRAQTRRCGRPPRSRRSGSPSAGRRARAIRARPRRPSRCPTAGRRARWRRPASRWRPSW